MKEFIKGKKYSSKEYIELSIEEMRKSKSEHIDKADPKVGAVLVDREGAYFDKGHRGELRAGDHGEYTLLERKHPGEDLSGFTLYTTLEPCVKRKFPKKGCYKRAINARLAKVVIGHEDPDPSVAGNGIKLLQKANIQVDLYDRKYERIIAEENELFFKEAKARADLVMVDEIQSAIDPIEDPLVEFQLSDLSEEAQRDMIEKMGLHYKLGSAAFNSYLNKMKLIGIDPESKFAQPTGLGLLLLGRNPQLKFPQARVKFTIRKKGSDPIIKDFDGALVLMPEKIEEYLEAVFPRGFTRTSFKRTSKVEASYTAVLEVIMNALVHRDYSIDGARIMVDIDDDKIVVSSPGEPLCEISKLNDFSAPSFSRNSKIAHIFYQMGFVEERGFGMEELSKIEKYGLAKPLFVLENKILKTTLFRNVDYGSQTFEKVDLPGLDILKEHERLSTKEYADLIERHERTALRHLSDLVANGLAYKDGKYYVYKP